MIGYQFSPILAPVGRHIDPRHPLSIGGGCSGLGTLASAAWATANKAFYIPFRVPFRVQTSAMGIWNGGTVSGNFDLGIYTEDGRRLVSSGSTAQSGANARQTVNVSVSLDAGTYYMGIVFDNTTATLLQYPLGITHLPRFLGCVEQASAFVLPATATFAAYTTTGNVPLVFVEFEDKPIQGSDYILPALPTIHPWSIESCGTFFANAAGGFAVTAITSRTYNDTQNRVRAWRFVVTQPTKIERILVFNGATAAGNIDVGIYTADGRRIVSSGSVAQSGTNTLQEFTVTATTLLPGEYWMAFVNDATTSTTMAGLLGGISWKSISTYFQDKSGIGVPLPATISWGISDPDVVTMMALSKRTVN